jgi:hypothetical protein
VSADRRAFSPRVNVAFRLAAGTVLFGSYNHFFIPPPIENVLVGSAGLTRFVSEQRVITARPGICAGGAVGLASSIPSKLRSFRGFGVRCSALPI